jgi:hypothetical protein
MSELDVIDNEGGRTQGSDSDYVRPWSDTL